MTIRTELANFLSGGNLIISTGPEKYEDTLIEILKFLVNEKKLKGIILTVNRSCGAFVPLLERNKINLNNLIIIDSISSTEEKREGNFIYLKRPFSPTTAAIRLEDLIKDPSIKFIIFDTLTTLVTYDSISIVKFFQQILSSLLIERKLSILLGIDIDTNDEEIKLVTQFCNKIIKGVGVKTNL